MVSRLLNRNVVGEHGRTTMRLEPELWNALREIGQREQLPVSEIVRRAEALAGAGGRTSAVRVYVIQYFRAAATEEGHCSAGHGPKPEDA